MATLFTEVRKRKKFHTKGIVIHLLGPFQNVSRVKSIDK